MTKQEITEALTLINKGHALKAVVENELEELGYIIQTHEPYATLTTEGKQMTYGEAAKTRGTKLYRALEANEKAHAERMKMTPEQREAYWKNAVKAR